MFGKKEMIYLILFLLMLFFIKQYTENFEDVVYEDIPVTQGLVGHYSAGNASSSKIQDMSSKNNHITNIKGQIKKGKFLNGK